MRIKERVNLPKWQKQQYGFLLPNYDTVAKEAAGIDLHITQTKRLGLIVINHQASTVRQ